MAYMPKRVKHRKVHRGRLKGFATRGNRVVFGEWGLQALDAAARANLHAREGRT